MLTKHKRKVFYNLYTLGWLLIKNLKTKNEKVKEKKFPRFLLKEGSHTCPHISPCSILRTTSSGPLQNMFFQTKIVFHNYRKSFFPILNQLLIDFCIFHEHIVAFFSISSLERLSYSSQTFFGSFSLLS